MTSEPRASAYAGRILEGKYRLVRLLGEGGMGEVYEAHHALIDRRLAVKLLHPEYAKEDDVVRRFQREAKASTAIGHEHIIDITDMGVADTGELFIVMEYLEGQSLGQVLESEGTIAPQRACHIMMQVLSALEAAHGKGIIHRDLKPDNVFLTRRGADADYVKLLDFGISKVKTPDDGVTKGLTRTGQILGTPSYMSPEQARGEADITTLTDIYSAGVIMFEVLTGVLPYESPSFATLLVKILTEEPADPLALRPDLPPGIAEAIRIAMSKQPKERYPDAASFRAALAPFSPEDAMAEGMDVGAVPQPGPGSVRGPMRRTPARLATTPLELVNTSPARKRGGTMKIVAGALAGLAVVLVGVVAYLALSGGGAQPVPSPAALLPVAPAAPAPGPAPAVVPEAPQAAPVPPQTVAVEPEVADTGSAEALGKKGRKPGHKGREPEPQAAPAAPIVVKVPSGAPPAEPDKPAADAPKPGKKARDLDEIDPW
jgi:tRNA A-37 threonylcarbamoyl transferase component Bud32